MAAAFLLAVAVAISELPALGAGGLLHPARRQIDAATPPTCVDFVFSGAGVALQEAALDKRVTAVVAAETFSDLRTAAAERAPFFFTSAIIGRAFRLAEQQGSFQVDAVSPAIAAGNITAPVLLVHGDADADTPVDHARRVFANLHDPKRLILVPGARHNGSLRNEVWDEIERWIDAVLARRDDT